MLKLTTTEKRCIITALYDRADSLFAHGYENTEKKYCQKLIEKLEKEWFPEKEVKQNG